MPARLLPAAAVLLGLAPSAQSYLEPAGAGPDSLASVELKDFRVQDHAEIKSTTGSASMEETC